MNHTKALEILELEQPKDWDSAEFKELVKTHFRKLSLKYHPDRGGSSEKFEEIKIAADILTGKAQTQTQMQQTVSTQSTVDPSFTAAAQIFGQAFTTMPSHINMNHYIVSPLRYPLDVTTTEMYHGISKTITVRRNILNKQSRQMEQASASYSIKIIPGSYHGQEIVIAGGGHQTMVGIMNDLIITLNEINDTGFMRDKQNLIYRHNVTLRDALLGGTLILQHPSGKQLTVNYRLKTPYDKTTISCMGMPIYGTSGSFGDLRVEFNVLFPKNIPSHMIVDIDGVLSALDYK